MNPSLCSEWLATNHLSQGMAMKHLVCVRKNASLRRKKENKKK
jgi:hypothetical protein